MLSYMIVVNDNGELKQISQQEIFDFHPTTDHALECAINIILDRRSVAVDNELDIMTFSGGGTLAVPRPERAATFRVQKTVDGGTVVVRSTPEQMAADDAEDRAIGAKL